MKTLIVLNVLLILIILSFVCFGCVVPSAPSSWQSWPEVTGFGFNDARMAPVVEGFNNRENFSAVEQELFNDLKDNKLTDADIRKLILDGVLTENIVDKFLRKIDVPPPKDTRSSGSGKAAADVVEGFDDKVDAFEASSMSMY